MPPALAHRVHHAGNPRAALRPGEGNPAPAQKTEHELEVLELFDRDLVQLRDVAMQLHILLEVQRGSGGLPLQMRVIHQHRGKAGADFLEPGGRRLFTPKQGDLAI